MLTLNKTIKILQKQYHENQMNGMQDPRICGIDIVAKIYNVSLDDILKKVYDKKRFTRYP